VKTQRNASNRDVRVESWSELNEALYEDAWKSQLGRFRSDFAFRLRPQLVKRNHRSRSRRKPA